MEEEKIEEYPQEWFEGETEKFTKDLKNKLDLINSEQEFNIPDNKKYYLSGVKYLHSLVTKKLKKEDGEIFWSNFSIKDLIHELNNINTLSKIISRTIFNLDCDVEILHLIVKDYYKRIITRINKNK